MTESINWLALDSQVCFRLYAASRAITRCYQPLLSQLGLTYPQYLVMLVLWEEDEPTVKRIGERLRLDSGTLTPLLKRLEQAGWLVRLRKPENEREVRIVLTDAGRALRGPAQAVPANIFESLGLEMAELTQLCSIVDKLLTNTSTTAGDIE